MFKDVWVARVNHDSWSPSLIYSTMLGLLCLKEFDQPLFGVLGNRERNGASNNCQLARIGISIVIPNERFISFVRLKYDPSCGALPILTCVCLAIDSKVPVLAKLGRVFLSSLSLRPGRKKQGTRSLREVIVV